MKAKTMLGLIACAGACVSLSAFANTTTNWFAVAASGTDATLTNVSTNKGVEVAESKFAINTELDEPLVFTPDASFAGTNRSDGVVTIAASVALTPSSVSDFAPSSAKVGIAVGVDGAATNYYGYAGAGWKVLTGEAVSVPDSGDTSFKLVLDYRNHTAQFYVGETLMTYNDTTPTNAPAFGTGTDTLLYVAASGSGSISTIDTDFEIAVAEYNNIKYGSVAEALVAAGEDKNAVAVVDENGATETPGVAGNGLQKWECAALGIAEDAQVGLVKSTKQNAGNITLAVAGTTAEDGVTVKYKIKKDGELQGDEYDADNIQIPMGATGSHTYEIVPVITAN